MSQRGKLRKSRPPDTLRPRRANGAEFVEDPVPAPEILQSARPVLAMILLMSAGAFLLRLLALLPDPPVRIPHPLEHLFTYGFCLVVAATGVLVAGGDRNRLFPMSFSGLLGLLLIALAMLGCFLEFTASLNPEHLHNEVRGIFG